MGFTHDELPIDCETEDTASFSCRYERWNSVVQVEGNTYGRPLQMESCSQPCEPCISVPNPCKSTLDNYFKGVVPPIK